MAIGPWLGKTPSKKNVNVGEVLCPKCGKINTPTKDERKVSKCTCERCGNVFTVAKQ